MSGDVVKELSVAELFQSGRYTIPIYQRNYAWGEPEVKQLIRDVLDTAERKHEDGANRYYYIGSLVVYRREGNDIYETIDGQQRHTTLGILLAVLKNAFQQKIDPIEYINLEFDSRKKSERTLRRLFLASEQMADEPEEAAIHSAYEIATRYLKEETNTISIEQFTDYLLHQVKVLRVIVPQDTDLNHYFEIMNNRGEQLEKHEVLKASLMDKLDNDTERYCFATVWDACADMNRYVQLGFASKTRATLFGADWSTKYPYDFQALCEKLSNEKGNKEAQTLDEILAQSHFQAPPTTEAGQGDDSGRFGSVINFSNFLLQVLKVVTEKDIPLDDKRLLESFDQYFEFDDIGDFILDLLCCRLLYDRYIIKRKNDEDWSLKKLKYYNKSTQKSFGYKNSITGSEVQSSRLIMILSMFHVSFPAPVYKHWLNAALSYLWCECDEKKIWVSPDDYLAYLEELSDNFFYGRFGDSDDPLDYHTLVYGEPDIPDELDETCLEQATNIPNFIFNRLDYLLWKKLKAGEIFEGVDMNYVQKRADTFSFTFRTSVEHYYPQHPISEKPMDDVDRFGNLCLISRSNNSKLSNYSPKAKKEHYEKADRAESLKQAFMMSYKSWGPNTTDIIDEHEVTMIQVLCEKV